MAEIHHNKVPLLKGDEPFIYQNGNKAGFTILDFWRFQFSNLLDMQGRVGEFIVAMALGKMDPDNNNGWTLWDIDYRETRIEVKTTAYFQPWRFERDENGNIINDDGKNYSEARTFSIRKANGEENGEKKFKRWSDIYVFVLNTGKTEKDADPRELKHWRFWVVKTKTINNLCKENKTISLKKLHDISKNKEGLSYDELKQTIDKLIDNN